MFLFFAGFTEPKVHELADGKIAKLPKDVKTSFKWFLIWCPLVRPSGPYPSILTVFCFETQALKQQIIGDVSVLLRKNKAVLFCHTLPNPERVLPIMAIH